MDKAAFFRRARTDCDGPLEGIRVIDVTTAWAGPMAACLLADLGCDVIRVDEPGKGGTHTPQDIPGTGRSFSHETVHRNKRSVSLDLRTASDVATVLALVATADIVVENFKPGTLDGWGVGYEDCRAVKKDIVYVSVSGWGQYGPWSDRPGYDPIALAASGWMSLNGSSDGPPVKAPTYLGDDLVALHAALAGLAALNHRNRTGEGQHVDVSLLDSVLYQSNGLPTLGATGVPLERWGSETGVAVPCATYACRDGHVYIAVALDAHWRRLTEVIGRPDLANAAGLRTNAERVANRGKANAPVVEWCRTRTTADVIAALTAVGIAVAPVNTYAEAVQQAHVREREVLVDVTLGNGTTAPLVAPAAKFSRTPTRIRRPAPDTGQHDREILGALGLKRSAPTE